MTRVEDPGAPPMITVERIDALRDVVRLWRGEGARIGFVPTMGSLHAGHMSLLSAARFRADRVIASVFVNPLQFGPTEDFARYPRTLDDDSRLASERGVDYMFTPTQADMYPSHAPVVLIHPGSVGKEWEGAVRPHHFEGVLTVVAKLFHIV
ncbi:MAG TPA: pantoate--beta-alanine ligase, partial [Steroidobacteraceae bacterium]|nr:pantoate--beta-alanine ligase [Steroidobacteraceae bacterium]